MLEVTHYIPILSTIIAFWFAFVLYRHWKSKPQSRYLLWWTIGVFLFGIGTLTEALTALFGWNIVIFKAWYIAGALLGAFPLAQGTVYLLFKQKVADILAWIFSIYVTAAAIFIILSPVDMSLVTSTLSGKVMTWQFARFFSPLPNTYALIFLVGGAAWSAIQYTRKQGSAARVTGNWLIAIGALLPGIGGSFTRLGHAEVLFVTEFIGIILIWFGYHAMTGNKAESIHESQKPF
jgi:hypothetical protein